MNRYYFVSKKDWESLQAGRTKLPMVLDQADLKQWLDFINYQGGPVRIAIREVSDEEAGIMNCNLPEGIPK